MGGWDLFGRWWCYGVILDYITTLLRWIWIILTTDEY